MSVPDLIKALVRHYDATAEHMQPEGGWKVFISDSRLITVEEPAYPNRKWSKRSRDSMEGIQPNLRTLCDTALVTSHVDFTVIEGLRTRARQRELVESGASMTMKSKHLDGRAIDVVAWHDGGISWQGGHFIPIADAFIAAARKHKIGMRWGGAWHVDDVTKPYPEENGPVMRQDETLDTHLLPMADEMMAAYVALRRSQGRRPFLDLGHFELV